MFDLFWLQKSQIIIIAEKGHHTDLNSPKKIGTEIDVHRVARNTAENLEYIDRPWAQEILLNKLGNRKKTSFTLTELFLKAAKELEIAIPFEEIKADTYADSVEKTLSQFFAREGQLPRKERG